MVNIRGAAILPRIRYLQEKFPEQWPQLVAALPEATRPTLSGLMLPTVWYPFSCFLDLNVTADRLAGKNDLTLVKELARHTAEASLNTFFKFFIRFGSPEMVLSKAASMWGLTYDAGRAEAVMTGKNAGAFIVKEFPSPHPVLCMALTGWAERALELTGQKDIVVHEKTCAARGGTECRFEGTWR